MILSKTIKIITLTLCLLLNACTGSIGYSANNNGGNIFLGTGIRF